MDIVLRLASYMFDCVFGGGNTRYTGEVYSSSPSWELCSWLTLSNRVKEDHENAGLLLSGSDQRLLFSRVLRGIKKREALIRDFKSFVINFWFSAQLFKLIKERGNEVIFNSCLYFSLLLFAYILLYLTLAVLLKRLVKRRGNHVCFMSVFH